jgi:hypothetical protein
MAGLVALPVPAGALDTIVSGFVAADLRAFVDDPRFEDQFDGVQASLILQPEYSFERGNRRDQFGLIPFARLDGRDSRRSHIDLREAWWRRVDADWELLLGINRIFWGVAESRHLVDIINQTDLVEDIDGEDRLGQPMLRLSTQRDWGELSLFVLPGFRERTFPGREGRLRFPLVTDGEADYQADAKQRHVDLALRYSHYVGAWDVGLHWFKGTGREPRFVPNDTVTRLVPTYDLIKQVGADVQYTRLGWLWKFEGLWRAQHGEHFVATTAGFEYTLYQIFETTADLGILLEYSYDGRDDDFSQAPPTLFEDDVFAGARLALNDVQSTELLAGFVVDRDKRSIQLSIEAERRLTDNWSAELESRWFLNTDDRDFAAVFRDDSYVGLRLSRYF